MEVIPSEAGVQTQAFLISKLRGLHDVILLEVFYVCSAHRLTACPNFSSFSDLKPTPKGPYFFT